MPRSYETKFFEEYQMFIWISYRLIITYYNVFNIYKIYVYL